MDFNLKVIYTKLEHHSLYKYKIHFQSKHLEFQNSNALSKDLRMNDSSAHIKSSDTIWDIFCNRVSYEKFL